jgi:hypothetical protein
VKSLVDVCLQFYAGSNKTVCNEEQFMKQRDSRPLREERMTMKPIPERPRSALSSRLLKIHAAATETLRNGSDPPMGSGEPPIPTGMPTHRGQDDSA